MFSLTGNPLRRYLLVAAVVILIGLALSGFIAGLFHRPDVKQESTQKTSISSASDRSAASKADLQALYTAISQQQGTFQQQLQQVINRQNDLKQDIQRETIRYVAPAANGGQPVIVTVPSSGSSPTAPDLLPQSAPGVPVEIVREIIHNQDQSKTTQTSGQNSQETHSTNTVESSTATAHHEDTSADHRQDASTTDTHTVETKKDPESRESSHPLGAGITTAGKPFVSYDVTSVRLGPTKNLNLGRIGAGVFASGTGQSDLDFGPDVTYTPKKSNLFGMVGYGVKSKSTVFGIGLRF